MVMVAFTLDFAIYSYVAYGKNNIFKFDKELKIDQY